ncbi:MAG: ionic transporter y4hA [Gammaproteobacteria bacterium]|nr:ionic transporter y4hA [Gammaproteobacteria bacterium]
MASHQHDTVPTWTWIAPVLASLLLILKYGGVVAASASAVQVAAAILIFGAVFASVHHAEVMALRLGEPFGAILLAVSVTVIEVALIISVEFAGGPGAETVARDTVFSAVMIVLNGLMGLGFVLGAGRHYEQEFQLQGALAGLTVLGPLAVIAMVLPNFTVAAPGPYYSTIQLIYVGAVSLVLWGCFVFVQTVRHRDYFLDVLANDDLAEQPPRQPARVTAVSAILLPVSLASVVLLGKILSYPVERAIAAVGLPPAFVGVVIAALVLMPEGLASIRAALRNRLQNALNLAGGSAIASIGLTIPSVALASLFGGPRLALGLSNENMVLLLLTLFTSTLTLGTGRTTVLQGVVHLVIFAVFLLLSAVP